MDLFKRQDSRFMESSIKHIKVFRNGDHSKHVEIALKPGTTFQNLRDEVLSKLGIKDIAGFRLYTAEGIELYEDYVPLIRDEDRLFVSLGEGFDQNTSLAEYKEISVLGEGGFGKVMLMEHTGTGEKYAVKFVDARKYGLASLIDMVFKEAELLKSLNHKNIVQITNFFALKDMKVVFVMEYLGGGELGEYLKKKGKLTEDEAREIFNQLLDAVNFCHMNNIIHRDLKLENILFEATDSKSIKVVDFGIAGFYSNMKGNESGAGSLRYMAPEVLTGRNKAANPAIDIWSMGCILHALLHGSLPFNGKNKKEIIEKIVYGKHQIAPELKKNLSPECIDLLTRMLIVDYKNRITTIEITNHPWVKGEKNVYNSTWYDDEDIYRSTEEEKVSKTKTKSGRQMEGILPHHTRSKGSFSHLEKDTFQKTVGLPSPMHRKSNSKDQNTMSMHLGLNKKSMVYEEVKRKEKVPTLDDIRIKEYAATSLQKVVTPRRALPTVPLTTMNGVKSSTRLPVGKKNL